MSENKLVGGVEVYPTGEAVASLDEELDDIEDKATEHHSLLRCSANP